MTSGDNEIRIQVNYKDLRKTFSGQVDDVWISINRFFSDLIPTFEIAKDIILTVDLPHLVENVRNLIAFTEESSYLLISKDNLTDNETLILHLLGTYVGYRLGILKSDALSRDELQGKLGKSPKITSTRLGELVRSELVTKTDEGKYKITTYGITQMQKDILPNMKEKIGI